MNEDSRKEQRVDSGSGFDSRDCRIVFIDGPSDPIDPNEPLDPKLLAFLTAEREKIARWTSIRKPQAESRKSAKQAESGDANQS